MKKINVDELKNIQKNILDVVAKFCDDNNINYWLDGGTLIGAIRHKGYIPWDDDIDLGMLRDDYDKFVRMFNKDNDRYQLFCSEINKNYNYAFGKVVDTTTELYEPDKKHGDKIAVNIDIFVYDNAPDDDKFVNKIFRKRNIYNIINSVKKSGRATTRKSFTDIIRIPCHYILKLLPQTFFPRRIIKNSKKYNNYETKRVGNFVGYFPMVCEKDVFNSFIDIEFEGKKYKAPVGYDKWLKSFYGDYMQLPPKEKRVSTHKFEAYKK